jgi:putative endonuclease
MMFYVYVLRSLKTGGLYTGSTKDLERSLVEHNSGLSNDTRNRAPLELVYKEEYNSKPEAYKRELFLKSAKGRVELKRLIETRE